MHHCVFLLINAEKRQAFRTTVLNISHLRVFKKSDWFIPGRWREHGAKADENIRL